MKKWILLILLIIVLIVGGYFVYRKFFTKNSDEIKISDEKVTFTETWQKGTNIIFDNTTSTDTHKISDNSYIMYQNGRGEISYSLSSDGKTWGNPVGTGVTEDSDKMISNPSVLEISANNWIMIYEQAPRRNPGQTDKQEPGVSNQRNLYLATSTDGKVFTKVGLAIDSSKEDNYFASVPDLVLLDNGTIRMYYVSGGDSTGSAISSDNGKTWVRESGYRLTDSAVDPDVLKKTENGVTKWVMYYTILDPQRNGINKAISTDGLTWMPVGEVISKKSSQNAVVDPDVIEITPDNYTMFFGQSSDPSSTGGEQIDLYSATYSGDIFN